MEITRNSFHILPSQFNEILLNYPRKRMRPHYSSGKASRGVIAEELGLYSGRTRTTKKKRTSTSLSRNPFHRIQPSAPAKSVASVAEDTELSAAAGS
ncbi:uncharacterized protein J3R85_008645, partial [Psidium guajava]